MAHLSDQSVSYI